MLDGSNQQVLWNCEDVSLFCVFCVNLKNVLMFDSKDQTFFKEYKRFWFVIKC